MSLRLVLLFLLAVPCRITLAAAENFGRVELSLSQWQETMDRLAKAESVPNIKPPDAPKAPCDAIISNIVSEIDWESGRLRLTTDFEIEILNDHWTTLPLADASFPLVSADTSGGRIIVRDKGYALLTEGKGKLKVRLVQQRTDPSDEQQFWVAAATSVQAKLTKVDPDSHVSLNNVELSQVPSAIGSTEADRTPLLLQRAKVSPAPTIDLAPGVWQSRSETQIGYEDGRLNYRSRVVLLCTSGNNQEATLVVPADCIVLQAEGDDLEKWELANEPGKVRLQLKWEKSGVRQRVVFLQLAKTQSNIVGPWPLVAAQLSDAAQSNEVWQVNVPRGLLPALPKEQPLSASLSNWMREQTMGSDSPVFLALAGSAVEVGVVKTIALAEARIESAKFVSELAMGGGMLTDAQFEMAVSERTTMDFQIEKGTRIISCRVAGEKQNPVDLGDGRIQLVVPSSGNERTTVQLSFSQQLPAFDPASGQVRLTTPTTSLLTKAGSWSVRLPAGLALSAFDGSVMADSAGPNGELRFHQELYRDSSPVVVLFYQKKIK